jgi:hypothetical protein
MTLDARAVGQRVGRGLLLASYFVVGIGGAFAAFFCFNLLFTPPNIAWAWFLAHLLGPGHSAASVLAPEGRNWLLLLLVVATAAATASWLKIGNWFEARPSFSRDSFFRPPRSGRLGNAVRAILAAVAGLVRSRLFITLILAAVAVVVVIAGLQHFDFGTTPAFAPPVAPAYYPSIWTTAPPIFDIAAAAIIVSGIGIFAALPRMVGGVQKPGEENFANIAFSISGIVVVLYVLYVVANALGGFPYLVSFLVRAASTPQPWTVWLTLSVWALLAVVSLWTLCRGLAAPLPPRAALPYGKYLITLLIFGGLWWWGAFVPAHLDAGFESFWQYAAPVINLILHCAYLGSMAEGAAGLLVALLSRKGGARRAMEQHMQARNPPMIPAERRRSWED